jgi:hypothetical protein
MRPINRLHRGFKFKWLICLSTFTFVSSCFLPYKKNEIVGTYVPINYTKNLDTIVLRVDNTYQRKVYDLTGRLLLSMVGQWTFDGHQGIEFTSFYLNLDDDLTSFPELASDTTLAMKTPLETENGKFQFCIGYYLGKNCYQRVNKD